MGVPYKKQITISKPTSADVYADIPFPHRGLLFRVLCVITSGSGTGCTLDIYDKDPADFVTADPAGMHTVIAQQNSFPVTLSLTGTPFVNQDAGDDIGPNKRLYAKIGGTGTGTFELALTATTSIE